MTLKDQAVHSREGKKPKTKARRARGRPTLSNAELLDKALDLFLENGFERTSIDAITSSAGMAKRTVYLRYKDKTALFKAALQRAIEEWIVPVAQLRGAESDDFEETLLRVGQILVANIMSPAGLRLLRITNAESVRTPEIGVYTYRHGTERTITYLADLFRRRVSSGATAMADAEEAAVAFLYLVVCGPATMTAWGMVLDDAAIDRHTRYCVQLFLHGLLPREAVSEKLHGGDHTGRRSESGVGQKSTTESQRLNALENENRRLKKLLLDSMLQVAVLKERQGSS